MGYRTILACVEDGRNNRSVLQVAHAFELIRDPQKAWPQPPAV
mgnify:CR=1 FL=1